MEEEIKKYSINLDALKEYRELPIPNLIKLFKKIGKVKSTAEYLQKIDSTYGLFFGHNVILSAKEPYGTMYPAIFSIMLGFGVADAHEEHNHNKLLVEFLKETNQESILKEFQNFWKDPFGSRIRAIPAIIIYNAYNEIHTDHVIKVKGHNPRLIIIDDRAWTLPEELGEVVECTELDALSLEWKNFFYCLR